jgi:hypothetical protein
MCVFDGGGGKAGNVKNDHVLRLFEMFTSRRSELHFGGWGLNEMAGFWIWKRIFVKYLVCGSVISVITVKKQW